MPKTRIELEDALIAAYDKADESTRRKLFVESIQRNGTYAVQQMHDVATTEKSV